MKVNLHLINILLPFCLFHYVAAMQKISAVDETTEEIKTSASAANSKSSVLPFTQTSPRSSETSDTQKKAEVPAAVTKPYPRTHFDFTTAKALQERNIAEALKHLIEHEEQGVWAALYCCDDKKFIEAWARLAQAKSLHGCLLLNKKQSEDPKEASQLEAKEAAEDKQLSTLLAHCKIARKRVDSIPGKRFTQMHNKVIIFECNESKKTLLVMGSANVSKWALATDEDSGHFEDIVILDDQAIISHYIAELMYMFEHSTEVGGSFSSTESLERLKALQLKIPMTVALGVDRFPTVCFREKIRDLVANLISWENEAVLGAQFQIHCTKVISAIESNKNIRAIALVIDPSHVNRLELFSALSRQRQLQLFIISRPLFKFSDGRPSDLSANTHHKFLIFKRNKDGKSVLLVGSANLSSQSLDHNWENAIATDDENLIKQFTGAFLVMKGMGRQVKNAEIDDAVRKKVMCLFSDTTDESTK